MITLSNVTCPYCALPARQVTGDVIYPHRPDLHAERFYLCAPCEAWVGCHHDGRPFGRLAKAPLRAMKRAAHTAFDRLWKPIEAQRLAYPDERRGSHKLQRVMRTCAYEWLATQMGLTVAECHIGEFDEAQCARVLEILRTAQVDAGVIRRWAKERRAVA